MREDRAGQPGVLRKAVLPGTVVEVADGEAALEALEHSAEPFDLVLLDVVMPRKDGYEVLAQIRERYGRVKVVLISGYNSPASISGGKSDEYAPDAILQKPFDWDEFQRVLDSVQTAESTI